MAFGSLLNYRDTKTDAVTPLPFSSGSRSPSWFCAGSRRCSIACGLV